MSLQNDYTKWLRRGRQRSAVARVLRKPMTGTEMCAAARSFAPRIQLRDVWFLMRQFEARGLATCLNPRLVTGRLYALTPKGQIAVSSAFGVSTPSLHAGIDWRKYAWVVRAKIRRLTLSNLEQLEAKTKEPQTATNIRRRIRSEYPVGLNPVIRAVRELVSKRLIVCVGVTRLRGCRLYRLTRTGWAITRQLNK